MAWQVGVEPKVGGPGGIDDEWHPVFVCGVGLAGDVSDGADVGRIADEDRSSLRVLREAVPYVAEVTNPLPARGGADAETLEEAKLRGPQAIKTRYRAVTAEDFEWLALRASGNVGRAKCLPATPREGEVLEQLQVGATNAEIAERLAIGVETVRTHARKIYRKLGIASRRELARLERQGLVDLERTGAAT